MTIEGLGDYNIEMRKYLRKRSLNERLYDWLIAKTEKNADILCWGLILLAIGLFIGFSLAHGGLPKL